MITQLLIAASDAFASLTNARLALLPLPLLVFLVFCVHRLYFSPLSHIPGPPVTALSQHYIALLQHFNLRSITLHRWHNYYGPVVRSSPTEVSIISPQGVKAVYSNPAYSKDSTFYSQFYSFGEAGSFSSCTAEDHGWRRRALTDRYTMSYIIKEEERTGNTLQTILNYLALVQDSVSMRTPEIPAPYKVDIFMLNIFLAVDVVTARLFGPALSTNCLAENEKGREMIKDHYKSSRKPHIYMFEMFPQLKELASSWSEYLHRVKKHNIIKEHRASIEACTKAQSITDYCWNSYQALKDDANPDRTLAEKLACIVDNAPKGDKSLTDKIAVSELMDHLFAGMTTTSDTLSFLMHQISLPASQRIQQRLRTELLSPLSPITELLSCNPGSPHKVFSVGTLSKLLALPYLDALLKETFRLYPAIPLTLPRVVPSSVDTKHDGQHIDGHFLPAGTIVGTFAYGIHRDPDVFTSADEFCPDRWLVSGISEEERVLEREKIKAMERRLWVFSSGGRGCLGRHLAMLEMKLFLAMVYSRYSTAVDMNERTRLPHDYWGISDTMNDVLPFPDVKGPVTFIPNVEI